MAGGSTLGTVQPSLKHEQSNRVPIVFNEGFETFGLCSNYDRDQRRKAYVDLKK
jgi:hypothetical protein